MSITVKIEIDPGTDIEDAKREAMVFAKRNQCHVRFKFNNLDVSVHLNGTIMTFDTDKKPMCQTIEELK